jgi:hypothetical protein
LLPPRRHKIIRSPRFRFRLWITLEIAQRRVELPEAPVNPLFLLCIPFGEAVVLMKRELIEKGERQA